jgi:hypothetical protein
MIFKSTNIELEISIIGYEFASYMNDYDDRNWLQVRCCYKNNGNIICKEYPSIYVYPNGKEIKGSISKSQRKAIGHIHGQTE